MTLSEIKKNKLQLPACSGDVNSDNFVPRLISWNLTFNCNLRCNHCYINAHKKIRKDEMSTDEGKLLIDQISEVSNPILILSGGEPLFRDDIFELAKYGTEKGLRIAIGTNGTLITDNIARQLKVSGVQKIAVSLDSSIPERHDEFRGVRGSWKLALDGIRACLRNNISIQINTTVTQRNYNEIENIMTLAEKVGASNFHLFFLVPTGRGKKMEDISPLMYEEMIREILEKSSRYRLHIRPTCAPQFMRIAKQMKLELKHCSRGCIAGLNYCRIYPTGEVTPCPYLPVKLGNVREKSFKDIWFNSEVLRDLRDFNNLKGKCGICEYRDVCGGCRARAYGLTNDFIDVCGSVQEPTELMGDYLAEEPWCIYSPKSFTGKNVDRFDR